MGLLDLVTKAAIMANDLDISMEEALRLQHLVAEDEARERRLEAAATESNVIQFRPRAYSTSSHFDPSLDRGR